MSPMTSKHVTEIFQRHGVPIVMLAALQQLQELAMAVSLQGAYAARMHYDGASHSLRIYVRDAAAPAAENDDGNQRQHHLIDIMLPRHGKPDADEASRQLGEALNILSRYLLEGAQ